VGRNFEGSWRAAAVRIIGWSTVPENQYADRPSLLPAGYAHSRRTVQVQPYARVPGHRPLSDGVGPMSRIARRVGIALGSFVIAGLAVSLVAGWLFGSGNILVWVVAVAVGAGVYLDILRRDRRVGSLRPDAVEETCP